MRQLVLVAIVLAFLGATGGDDSFDFKGITYNVVPRDAIPSLVLPSYVSVPQVTYLRDDDRVISVHYAGADLAYPTRILDHHEIVNDLVNGQPLLVTYCPLCGSGAAFIPVVEGSIYIFGVSGNLYQSDLLMYDRTTNSLWVQISGTAVKGKETGKRLTPHPVAYDTWNHWKAAHPDGRVLGIPKEWRERFGDYATSPYLGYDSFQDLWFNVSRLDTRLPNKTRIIGVEVMGSYKAYPESRLAASQVIHDRIGDVPIALVVDRERSRIGAFEERRHSFALKNGAVVDERGRTWTWDGNVLVNGRDAEQSYAIVPAYWFAWGAIHPTTDIYR